MNAGNDWKTNFLVDKYFGQYHTKVTLLVSLIYLCQIIPSTCVPIFHPNRSAAPVQTLTSVPEGRTERGHPPELRSSTTLCSGFHPTLVVPLCPQRGKSSHQHEQAHTRRPHIHFRSHTRFPQPDLGCCIMDRTQARRLFELSRCPSVRTTKINEVDAILRIHQDVFQLDVVMDITTLVNVIQCCDQLRKDVLDLRKGQAAWVSI